MPVSVPDLYHLIITSLTNYYYSYFSHLKKIHRAIVVHSPHVDIWAAEVTIRDRAMAVRKSFFLSDLLSLARY